MAVTESYDLTVRETSKGNWEALTKDEPPFAVEAKTPGQAVDGMINILRYWEETEQEND